MVQMNALRSLDRLDDGVSPANRGRSRWGYTVRALNVFVRPPTTNTSYQSFLKPFSHAGWQDRSIAWQWHWSCSPSL